MLPDRRRCGRAGAWALARAARRGKAPCRGRVSDCGRRGIRKFMANSSKPLAPDFESFGNAFDDRGGRGGQPGTLTSTGKYWSMGAQTA